jgi:hypothetical protein
VKPGGEVIGENTPRLSGDIRAAIRDKGLYTIPSSCLFWREALKDIGGYDETLSSHIDHDIWLQLAEYEYGAEYVNECLVKAYHHQGYQMTTDVESRLEATEVFCDKWRPKLTEWWGYRRARKYCVKFKARVMGMLGWAYIESKNNLLSVKAFLGAIYRDPSNRRYYQGLLASLIGKNLYDLLIRKLKSIINS